MIVNGHPTYSKTDFGKKWSLPDFKRNTCILGASNLNRITARDYTDLQIDSFPGMRLGTLSTLFERYKPSSGFRPRHLILAVGSNDRYNKPQTTRIHIDRILQTAHKKLPGTKIHMAQLNVSDSLPLSQHSTLHSLNSHLRAKWPDVALPPLPDDKFDVTTDGIHWTEQCANHTLDHWLDCLN